MKRLNEREKVGMSFGVRNGAQCADVAQGKRLKEKECNDKKTMDLHHGCSWVGPAHFGPVEVLRETSLPLCCTVVLKCP